MLPVFQNGWIIYYSAGNAGQADPGAAGWQVPYNKPVRGDAYAEFIGKPCIIKLSDGRLFLRTLKRSSEPDKYNLVAYNGEDINDARIESVAKIVFIRT